MKRIINAIVSSTCAVLLVASCVEELPQVEPDIRFELYDVDAEGENLYGLPLEFNYGETRTFKMVLPHVTGFEVESGPKGWTYRFLNGNAIITSPSVSDDDFDESGSIDLKVKFLKGTVRQFKIDVSLVKVNPEVLGPNLTGITDVPYGKSVKLDLVLSSSVRTMGIQTPEGWSAEFSLEESAVEIFAPADEMSGSESGTVNLTPYNRDGVAGPVFGISVRAAGDPVVTMDGTDFMVGNAETIVKAFTYRNAVSAVVTECPEGWTCIFDLSQQKMTVTAPDKSSTTAAGAGRIVIHLTSEEGRSSDFICTVKMDIPGILTAEDFVMFGSEVASGGAISSKYLVDGVPTLAMSVDLSLYTDKLVFVGSDDNPFKDTFNGNGKTVRISIDLGSTPAVQGGLFAAVENPGKIKDLTVEGTISYTGTTAANIKGMAVGAVAARSNGGTFENITSKVNYTYTSGSWINMSTNESSYGGIVGKESGAGVYTGNVSTGTIRLTNGTHHAVGGQIGYIATQAHGANITEITDCVNKGTITVFCPTAGSNGVGLDNTCYGGIVGCAPTCEPHYLRCINGESGSSTAGVITIDLNNFTNTPSNTAYPQVLGAGGVAGVSAGTFENCKNFAPINGLEKNGSVASNGRNYGGILGSMLRTNIAGESVAANIYDLRILNCENHGTITHTSAPVGGIAGHVRETNYMEIKGCTNYGDIVNATVETDYTKEPTVVGGIVGIFRGDLMENCVNEGSITGQYRWEVGGIIGQAYNIAKAPTKAIQVKNCENKGTINVSSVSTKDAAGNYLTVCGIAVLHWKTLVNFENCKNTGKITVKSQKTGHVKPIWLVFSQNGSPLSDATMDASTTAEQDKTDDITEYTLE